jgi:hypothetical protein
VEPSLLHPTGAQWNSTSQQRLQTTSKPSPIAASRSQNSKQAAERAYFAAQASTITREAHCTKLTRQTDTYLNTVSNVYDSNPEQKSIVLLTVMELCMPMVTCATELFSFLTEFNPRIPPEALDVLQLPAFVDICHLQRIGEYLRGRCTKCKFCHWTILEDPVTGCFAERYFDESVDSRRLQEFYRRILIAAEFAREKKEEEWKELNAEFEELERTLAGSSCIYTTTDIGVIHDGRGAGSAISGVGPNF